MTAKYGDVVTRGFDGAGVAESMRAEGVDLMVLYTDRRLFRPALELHRS
jgi:hypothetical protein